jgi:hypothetical protein
MWARSCDVGAPTCSSKRRTDKLFVLGYMMIKRQVVSSGGLASATQ